MDSTRPLDKQINRSTYLLIFLSTQLFLTGSIYRPCFAEEKSAAREAELTLGANLPALRTNVRSLHVSAGRIPALTIPEVERFFDAPLSLYSFSEEKLSELEDGPLLFDRLAAIDDLFGIDGAVKDRETADIEVPPFSASIPTSLRPVLGDVYRDLAQAKVELDKAVSSVSNEEKEAYLTILQESVLSSRRSKEIYQGMSAFDDESLMKAGQWFAKGIDRLVAGLPAPLTIEKPLTWDTPLGKFRINGAGDDTVDDEAIKNVCVLIDLGGRNSYSGATAAAKNGEIRLVVDYGSDVTLYSSESEVSNAGSGIFGLGALVLPNAEGLKRVVSPSFSQGCGIGGVGIFLSSGPVQLEGRRFVQGVGSFGIGLLHVSNGFRSTYTAQRSAQGLGLTRGVGVFLHQGDAAEIRGGLVEPDPREPLGTVSLCQGVGYGPRGYTGGGIGVASIQGSSVSVLGSYFAQGCGYWHGLGVFRLTGNDNTVQARRYDQGTGVHNAFGHFSLRGNRNTIVNWGVGPAYGWDRALGTALIVGNDNRYQAEWGAAQGSIGGLSLSFWKGDRNTLALGQFGAGSFYRDDIGLSLHVIEGADNRLKYAVSSGSNSYVLQPDPWGFIRLEGGRLESEMKPIPVGWPEFPKLKSDSPDVDLPSLLTEAQSRSPRERQEQLVDLAAAFSVDKGTPRSALELLLQSSTSDVGGLVDLLDPAAVDQLIQLRILLCAFGPEAGEVILRVLPSKPDDMKGLLLSFLDAAPSSLTIPSLQKIVDSDPDLKQKTRALLVLSRLFSLDNGNEPGQRAALRALVHYLKSGKKQAIYAETNSLLTRLFVSDAFSLMAKTLGFNAATRVNFLHAMPPDLTETIGPTGALAIFDRIAKNGAASLATLQTELDVLEGYEPQVRRSILAHLSGPPEIVQAAIIALGQIANPQDAVKIGPSLKASDPRIREAATTALGRMGEAGLATLKRVYSRADPQTRRLILASVPLATAEEASSLVEVGMEDRDPSVRLAAVAALMDLSPAVEKRREHLLGVARVRAEKEKDISVRVALEAAIR